MPSTKKTIHFLSCALITCIPVGLLGYGLSTNWAKTAMKCTSNNTANLNGTAEITFTLFNGTLIRNSCPNFGTTDPFEVFPLLTKIGGTPLALHALCLSLVILCILTSVVTILISVYNSVSNPYETYLGPRGVYASSCLSVSLAVLVLIVFVLNVTVTDMAEDMVKKIREDELLASVLLENKSAEMLVGYYLLIPCAVLFLVATGVIYMYDHAAYTQKKEHAKPTEDAPKEIMMY